MQHDVLHDFGVVVHVFRRLDVRAFAAPEAEDHFRADAFDARDQAVRGAEVVALRVLRVRLGIGEDAELRAVRVDERAGGVGEDRIDIPGAVGIMRAHQIDAGFAVAASGVPFPGYVPATEHESLRLVETLRGRAIHALQ